MVKAQNTYQEVIDYLFAQFPQYQRIGAGAYKSGLEGMLALDRVLEQPHKKFASIHVAGTNGKGSVSHMLAAILQRAGYRVGLYTSPHLIDFRERIRINGEMIPKEEVAYFVKRYKASLEEWQSSFFEITTAMAFHHFAQQGVEVAVVETGLGGRLDSTNIIEPILSVITNIGLDHCEYLGNTLAQIAAEKAGIIKFQTPAVIGERHLQTDRVFMERARTCHAPLYFAQDLFRVNKVVQEEHYQRFFISEGEGKRDEYLLDLKGLYQQKNVPTVLMATALLKKMERLSNLHTWGQEEIKQGLKEAARSTRLRARWESISHSPKIVIDAAHNAHGLRWVVEQLEKEQYERLHFVLGVAVEKELSSILPLLPKEARYYFTQAQIPRAMDAEILYKECAKAGLWGEVIRSVPAALAAAQKNAASQDFIFVGGSIFVAAEALEIKQA